MKYILRMFGLIRLKDLQKYLDEEINFFQDARKNLTDINQILEENQTNKLSNCAQLAKQIKIDTLFLNKWW